MLWEVCSDPWHPAGAPCPIYMGEINGLPFLKIVQTADIFCRTREADSSTAIICVGKLMIKSLMIMMRSRLNLELI